MAKMTFLQWYEALDKKLQAKGSRGSDFEESDLRREFETGADPAGLAASLMAPGPEPERNCPEAARQNAKAPDQESVVTHIGALVIVMVTLGFGAVNSGLVEVPFVRSAPSPQSSDAQQAEASKEASEKRRSLAFYMAQEFVKRKLKAPATASFSSFYDPDSYGLSENSDGSYTVSATVDSENSFGAKVRSRFVSRLRPDPSNPGYWLDLGTEIVEQ